MDGEQLNGLLPIEHLMGICQPKTGKIGVRLPRSEKQFLDPKMKHIGHTTIPIEYRGLKLCSVTVTVSAFSPSPIGTETVRL